MNIFKVIPSCSVCKYANTYIPYYTYPFSDPFCELGHGQCEPDKCCEDFELLGREGR